jgi:hypothetical protein
MLSWGKRKRGMAKAGNIKSQNGVRVRAGIEAAYSKTNVWV